MKLAIIRTGGKQYLVHEGMNLKIERLSAEPQTTVELDTLLTTVDEKLELGQPLLTNKVKAEVVRHAKAKKIRVQKFKPKVRYDKVYGHRQPFTEIKINSI
jgi:large subunit ribosomal protein L21